MRQDYQAPPHAAGEDIDIASLWGVLRRYGGAIAGVALLIGLATFAGLSLVTSKYTSETQILIGGKGLSDPFRDPKVGLGMAPEAVSVKVDKEAIASQVIALRSRDLAGRLASELKLATRPEFNTALEGQGFVSGLLRLAGIGGPRPGETEEERVLSAYSRALQVYQGKDTRVITIEFTSVDSEFAAVAANRLADLYQDWLRAQGVSQTADASEWLKPQIDKLAREVSEAEAAVERFRAGANLLRGGSQNVALNDQQLADLAAEVTRVRTARAEVEARARSARDLLQRGSIEAIPDVQRSPVIQALIGQRVRAEREKAEAETSLLAGHPRMKQLNANVADLRRQVTRAAMVVVDGLEREVKVLALREELTRKSLDDTRRGVGDKAGDFANLAALEGQARAKRRELETLQASFEATLSRRDAKAIPLEAQIISRARASSVPTSPKRAQIALLASAASLILGFVVVVTRELLGGQRHPEPDRLTSPRAATVAATRHIGLMPSPPDLTAHFEAAPASASAGPARRIGFASLTSVAAIAQHLLATAGEENGYRTLIVGADREVPIHEATADLIDKLCEAGRKVVLIDWTYDGQGMARDLGIDAAPGMMDLLSGSATLGDVIRRIPGSTAHIVPCGTAQSALNGALDRDRINLVLDALDETYDHLVVVGMREPAHGLFMALQGRFDAGIVVGDGSRPGAALDAAPGSFLGFEVTDIDVMRLETAPPSGMAGQQRDYPHADLRA